MKPSTHHICKAGFLVSGTAEQL